MPGPVTTGVITAVYGGYDEPKPLPADHGFDRAVLVTDRDTDAPGWDVIVEPRPELHPRLAAKVPKCLPWAYLDTDRAAWIDGAYALAPAVGFREAVDERLDLGADVVAFRHPDRASRPDAYAEARFTHDHYHGKYEPRQRLLDQADHYRTLGYPEASGLYACGVLAYARSATTHRFGRRWLAEQATWTVQDQVSFPFVAWKHAIRLGTWAHEQWSNPWLTWHAHRDES